jgi:putative phosphoribosyl transferase
MYSDRTEAGEKLADALEGLALPRPVVLALPRGGVPVALPVARRLHAPIDLLLVRKIGVPGHEELAAGALIEGAEPVWNGDVLALEGLTPEDFARAIAAKRSEIAERRKLWLAGRAPVPLDGRTAIVVDDGIATGATMRAALAGLAGRGAAEIVLAVPVAAPDSLAALAPLASRVVCPEQPQAFYAVGAHYAQFAQVPDNAVAQMIAEAG